MILLMVSGVLFLSACGSNRSGSASLLSGPGSSSSLTLEQAEQIAETFLKAWQQTDYGTMYALISPNSRDAYTQEAFTSEYQDAATQITVSTLETRITSSLRQGTTAVIMYDVVFHSELFGDITDAGRMMRLIETPDGWRVAWSSMDIFSDLAEGARLQRVQTLPNRGNIYDRNGKVLVDQNGRAVLLRARLRNRLYHPAVAHPAQGLQRPANSIPQLSARDALPRGRSRSRNLPGRGAESGPTVCHW